MSTQRVLNAYMDQFGRTMRTMTGDWCQECGHCRDDHSRILVDAPCLECACWAWQAPKAEPWPDPPGWQPEPVHVCSWWHLHLFKEPHPRVATRIHNRTLPSTAELWTDGKAVP